LLSFGGAQFFRERAASGPCLPVPPGKLFGRPLFLDVLAIPEKPFSRPALGRHHTINEDGHGMGGAATHFRRGDARKLAAGAAVLLLTLLNIVHAGSAAALVTARLSIRLASVGSRRSRS